MVRVGAAHRLPRVRDEKHGLHRRPRHRQSTRARRRHVRKLRRDRGRVSVRQHECVPSRGGEAETELVVLPGLAVVADGFGVDVSRIELGGEVDCLAGARRGEQPTVAGEVFRRGRVVAPERVGEALLRVGRVPVERDRLAERLAGEDRQARYAVGPDLRLDGVAAERIREVGVVVRFALHEPAPLDRAQLPYRAVQDAPENRLRLSQFADELLDARDRVLGPVRVLVLVGFDRRCVGAGFAIADLPVEQREVARGARDVRGGRRRRIGGRQRREARRRLPAHVQHPLGHQADRAVFVWGRVDALADDPGARHRRVGQRDARLGVQVVGRRGRRRAGRRGRARAVVKPGWRVGGRGRAWNF